MKSLTSFRGLYCLLSTDFTNCFGISFVNFEQVNACWVTGDYLQIPEICALSSEAATGRVL